MKLHRDMGFYEKYIKRFFDILVSLIAIIVLCWLYIIIAIMVKIKMGSPVIFKQLRPGLVDKRTNKECLFYMYKFRTMTDECGEDGKLLPDDRRLPQFGKWLRSTSLDELPELFNVLKGDMSLVGPRPQLVRDMVFMDDNIRMRHTARPGITGLAQVNGRNAISWEDKFSLDLQYLGSISFHTDIKTLLRTIRNLLGSKARISEETKLALDYGEALLQSETISREEFELLIEKSQLIVNEFENV